MGLLKPRTPEIAPPRAGGAELICLALQFLMLIFDAREHLRGVTLGCLESRIRFHICLSAICVFLWLLSMVITCGDAVLELQGGNHHGMPPLLDIQSLSMKRQIAEE